MIHASVRPNRPNVGSVRSLLQRCFPYHLAPVVGCLLALLSVSACETDRVATILDPSQDNHLGGAGLNVLPTYVDTADVQDPAWWIEDAPSLFTIHNAHMYPINRYSDYSMSSEAEVEMTWIPLLTYSMGEMHETWTVSSGNPPPVFNADHPGGLTIQGVYLDTKDAPWKCNEIDGVVSVQGQAYGSLSPMSWPLPGPSPSVHAGPEQSNIPTKDCTSLAPPPPPSGGGDPCELGGLGDPGECEEGWVCEWVEWGLFMWDGSQWVLVDSWLEEECYWEGGGGPLH